VDYLIERTLVTGGHGRLGKEMQKIAPDFLYPTHEQMDFTKITTVERMVQRNDVAKIIHLGALTSVTKCEEDRKLAWKVNVEGTKNIVKICREYNLTLWYMSTPCVFDGESAPYFENSIPSPKNYYGKTKAIGEQLVQSLEDYKIIRSNFVPKEKWPFEGAYTDRFGTYIYAHDLAWWLLMLKLQHPVNHICGGKRMSMYELAKITTPEVKPITMEKDSILTRDMTLGSLYVTEKIKIDGVKR
jgi:dTDP-4-dehydrorhamnose reductase